MRRLLPIDADEDENRRRDEDRRDGKMAGDTLSTVMHPSARRDGWRALVGGAVLGLACGAFLAPTSGLAVVGSMAWGAVRPLLLLAALARFAVQTILPTRKKSIGSRPRRNDEGAISVVGRTSFLKTILASRLRNLPAHRNGSANRRRFDKEWLRIPSKRLRYDVSRF